MAKQDNVLHREGPFEGIVPGDTIRVIYQNHSAALVRVTRVKQYALEGKDGECDCKITKVGLSNELRFYGRISEVRQTVLRHIKIVKEEAN